jgi:hypothetical protein
MLALEIADLQELSFDLDLTGFSPDEIAALGSGANPGLTDPDNVPEVPAKDRFALSRGHYHWQHEPCWYAVRDGGSSWTGDRKQSTLWQIPAREGQGFEHGTQKPVLCMQRPIENNSSPGQAVYEPFSGSGTTIIAAEMTGRACYAIELLGQYVDVAVERWQAFTGEEAKLEADGRTFAAIAAERRPESQDT